MKKPPRLAGWCARGRALLQRLATVPAEARTRWCIESAGGTGLGSGRYGPLGQPHHAQHQQSEKGDGDQRHEEPADRAEWAETPTHHARSHHTPAPATAEYVCHDTDGKQGNDDNNRD